MGDKAHLYQFHFFAKWTDLWKMKEKRKVRVFCKPSEYVKNWSGNTLSFLPEWFASVLFPQKRCVFIYHLLSAHSLAASKYLKYKAVECKNKNEKFENKNLNQPILKNIHQRIIGTPTGGLMEIEIFQKKKSGCKCFFEKSTIN